MAPKKRLKSAAAVYVPQTREQVISDIKNIGDLQREPGPSGNRNER